MRSLGKGFILQFRRNRPLTNEIDPPNPRFLTQKSTIFCSIPKFWLTFSNFQKWSQFSFEFDKSVLSLWHEWSWLLSAASCKFYFPFNLPASWALHANPTQNDWSSQVSKVLVFRIDGISSHRASKLHSSVCVLESVDQFKEEDLPNSSAGMKMVERINLGRWVHWFTLVSQIIDRTIINLCGIYCRNDNMDTSLVQTRVMKRTSMRSGNRNIIDDDSRRHKDILPTFSHDSWTVTEGQSLIVILIDDENLSIASQGKEENRSLVNISSFEQIVANVLSQKYSLWQTPERFLEHYPKQISGVQIISKSRLCQCHISKQWMGRCASSKGCHQQSRAFHADTVEAPKVSLCTQETGLLRLLRKWWSCKSI